MSDDILLDSEQNSQQKKKNTQEKVSETSLGCLAGIGLGIITWSVLSNLNFGVYFLILMILIYLTLIILSFYKKKRFVAIGLILAILVPLLVFGGCLMLFDLNKI